MIDPRFLLEPLDIEFEVAPEFLLNDSEDEQSSLKQGEHSKVDMKKPLEEAKGPNPKEHVIDEALGASSDEDCCVIVENTEVKKGPKIRELTVDQGQGTQKTLEAAPKCPSTVVTPVHRPEAVVEPMVRTDLPSSNVAEEREQEQREYELAQHMEMLRNLPYELSMAQQQMGQERENHIYRPQDQMVTVINDLGPLPTNFFGNDNSVYPRNETHSLPLLTTEERMGYPFCPILKKILIIVGLKRTSILIHSGK
ncbi:protein model 1141, (NCBI) [Sigmodon hispidus]